MKVGIYGCQNNPGLMLSYLQACEGVETVAVVDENLDKARSIALENGISQVAEALQTLVNMDDMDLVYVNAIPPLRYGFSTRALQSGLDVLVDSPISFNTEEIEALYQLAETHCRTIYLLPELPLHRIKTSIENNVELNNPGKFEEADIILGLREYTEWMRSYPQPNTIPWYYQLKGHAFQNFLPDLLQLLDARPDDVRDCELSEFCSDILPRELTDELVLNCVIRGAKVKIKISFKDSLATSQMTFRYLNSVIHLDLYGEDISTDKQSASAFIGLLGMPFRKLLSRARPQQDLKQIVIGHFCSVYNQSNSFERMQKEKDAMISAVASTQLICDRLLHTQLLLTNYIPDKNSIENQGSCVLVTGGTGLFGMELVDQLRNHGYRVRVLARKLSNTSILKQKGVEIYLGDVSDAESVASAMNNIDYVVHAAADSIGDKQGGELSTILGTRNILEKSKQMNVKKLVYISSCSVYEVATYESGSVLDENACLERKPELRGAYSFAKIEAEKLVREQQENSGMQITCLRPGTYFGPGKYMFTPIMGLNIKNRVFFVIRNKKLALPYVYYKNVANAVLAVLNTQTDKSAIYNVIDETKVNKHEYVNDFLKKVYPRSTCIFIPYMVFYLLALVFELLGKLTGVEPMLTRYRLRSSQNAVFYSADRIKNELDWKPPYTLYQGFENVIESTLNKVSN